MESTPGSPGNPKTLRIGGEIEVNRLGFGAMRLPGDDRGANQDRRSRAHQLLRRAVELGVNLIDTAPLYGESEAIIGEALAPYPPGVEIATKVGIVHSGSAFEYRGRPEQIRADCERSLQRLRLETITLSQLHTIDPEVPIEESVGALVDLQRQGKVRHVGVSNVSVAELRRAQSVGVIASVQNRYSVTDRGSQDVLDVCAVEGIAFLPWRPLGQASLTGAAAAGLAAVAARLAVTPQAVALAWLLHRSPVLVPIPGTGQPAHLEANLAAVRITLTDPDLALLEASAG